MILEQLQPMLPELSRALLPAEGVQQIYNNIARQNLRGTRQSVLSKCFIDRHHQTESLTFYVHAVAAPERANDVFFGVTEADQPWGTGRTIGMDCSGKLRSGPSPASTQRHHFLEIPKDPAPKTSSFKISVNLHLETVTIDVFKSFDDALEGKDMCFSKSIGVYNWKKARLWASMGEQWTTICVAKVKRVGECEVA